MVVSVDPKSVTRFLVSVVTFLTIANVVAQVLKFGFGYDYALGFYPAFDLNKEGNIPTYYSALALMLAALLLAVVARHKSLSGDGFKVHWMILSLLFAFLSFDEASQIHEIFVAVLQPKYDLQGVLFFVWVVPYGILTLIFAFMYLRFLRDLPSKTAKLFVTAAIIFLSGAVGLEVAASVVVSSLGGWESGFYHLNHVILYSIEEPLEMFGIVIFVYAILDYLAGELEGGDMQITFEYR